MNPPVQTKSAQKPPAPKNRDRGLTVLGIETSCDETAAAIVTEHRQILAQALVSQKDHEAYGGVVPEVAARAHLRHLETQVRETLAAARLGFDDLDAVAVTAGPGLIGGVLVGAVMAKAIALARGLPLLAVNHLEGHALTPRLSDDVPFPYLLLLVSGGHCQILIVRGVGDYTRLGATIDDAVGEAFDKTAKLMGLGYPGGPAVERMAALSADPKAAAARFALPRPLIGQDSCDFSFSGLKTAVRRAVEAFPAGAIGTADAADLCAAFQMTVGDILVDRAARALDRYLAENPPVPTLVVAGGVAANQYVRERLQDLCARRNAAFAAPPLRLCTDNAAMIAWAGIERYRTGPADDYRFPVRPRWPLDPDAAVASPKSQKT
jgi:N6-L-threonylcarbamoyladenine synthase